jgi:hypothetical protein
MTTYIQDQDLVTLPCVDPIGNHVKTCQDIFESFEETVITKYHDRFRSRNRFAEQMKKYCDKTEVRFPAVKKARTGGE